MSWFKSKDKIIGKLFTQIAIILLERRCMRILIMKVVTYSSQKKNSNDSEGLNLMILS